MSPSLLGLGQSGKVLLLGAHSDDIEIGCGGTVLRMIRACPGIQVHWHVFSTPGLRRREAQNSAREFLKDAGQKTVRVESFRESYFPDQWSDIKDVFGKIRRQFEPDFVFTHRGDDRHQDHRVLSELTWNTFRNHLILEYEIPKYEGDLGQPNLYVTLAEDLCRQKVSALLRHFPTQATKPWFTEDAFLALLRLRGIECGPKAHYAEAFHARKLVC
jgi:LmbE family N-acetylglucosaminyl deacetylase